MKNLLSFQLDWIGIIDWTNVPFLLNKYFFSWTNFSIFIKSSFKYFLFSGSNICSYIFHGACTPPLYILMQSYNNHCMDRIGGFPEAVPSINYIGRQLVISYIGREMYGESVLFKRVLPWVISVRVLSDHKHIHATPIDGKIIVLQRTWTTRPLSIEGPASEIIIYYRI